MILGISQSADIGWPRDVMICKTTDWEVEAKRITQAYGVSKSCLLDEELSLWADDSASKGTEPKTSVNMRVELADSKYDKIRIRNEQFLQQTTFISVDFVEER